MVASGGMAADVTPWRRAHAFLERGAEGAFRFISQVKSDLGYFFFIGDHSLDSQAKTPDANVFIDAVAGQLSEPGGEGGARHAGNAE